ncbi:MAG TPA: GNAT family N-acetyltransferase [Myxococcales bacterium]|nr:GNAT family N-acetyltransferase [Myxococcales bacterium]
METGILLRGVVDQDLPLFFEHQSDPEASRMAAFPIRDPEAFTAHWTRIRRDETVITRTILRDGAVVGYVGSFTRSGERLLAYWIGRDWWGRGIATQALTTFLEHDRTRPLRARVARHNVASIRVLEKRGFLLCGSQMDGDVEELVFELK